MAQTILPLTTDVIIDDHDFDEHVEEGETVYLYLKDDSTIEEENTVEMRLGNGMKIGRLSSDSSVTIRSKIASGIELRGKIRRIQEDKNFCNVKIYKPSFCLRKTPSTYRAGIWQYSLDASGGILLILLGLSTIFMLLGVILFVWWYWPFLLTVT